MNNIGIVPTDVKKIPVFGEGNRNLGEESFHERASIKKTNFSW
jgi:hypothetical protein